MNESTIQVLTNITNALGPWWNVLTLLAYFIGFGLVILGVILFGAQDRSGRSLELKRPTIAVIVGILLLNLIPFLDAVSMSMFGQESAKVLSYEGASGQNSAQAAMMKFSIFVTMLVGLGSVIKGLYGIYSASHDPRGFWPAVAHIGGGFLALNIVFFMEMIGSTAGGVVQETISNLVTG